MSFSDPAQLPPLASAVTRLSLMLEGREIAVALAAARAPEPGASTDDLDRHVAVWLRGEELGRYRRFAVDHARRDFLAGRAAAKSAVQALAPGTRAPDWEIVRGAWHQPCLRGPAGGLAVTLAHAGGLGLAVAFDDGWLCGIDLESSAREAEPAIASQVSTDEATWACSASSEAERSSRWLLLWTAREAQGKCLRTGLLRPAALAPTRAWTVAPHGWRAHLGDDDLLRVRAVQAADFIVSLALPRAAADGVFADEAAAWLHAMLARG